MSVDRLLDAAYDGNITMAMNELHYGVSINAANKRGMTALHYTARQGHAEATRKLLERGARTSVVDAEGRTPLQLACKEGHAGAAAALIGSGLDAVASRGKSAVYYACWSGQVEVCRLLRDATDLKIATNVQAVIGSVLDWDVDAPRGKYTAMLQYLLRVQDRLTRAKGMPKKAAFKTAVTGPPLPPPLRRLATTATAPATTATAAAAAAIEPPRMPAAAAAAAAIEPHRMPQAAAAAAATELKLAQPTAQAASAQKAAATNEKAAAANEKATPSNSCCICFGADSATIITCSSGEHSLCADCLNSFVTAEADSGKHHIAAKAGKLRCPGVDCTSVYEHYDLAQHLSRQSFDKLLAASNACLEQSAVQTAAEQAKREAARAAEQSAVARARAHIIDSILTLKCPSCDKAFAVCGYCLQQCAPHSVHQHVAACKHNTAAGHDVWGTRADFDTAQQRRQQRLLEQYLDTLPAALHEQVLAATAQDLRSSGIHFKAAVVPPLPQAKGTMLQQAQQWQQRAQQLQQRVQHQQQQQQRQQQQRQQQQEGTMLQQAQQWQQRAQ
jgi:uncharacterized protein